MTDELEDWQLALLVEARKYDDPEIVEADQAEALREHREVLSEAQETERPVVVDYEEAQMIDQTEALREKAEGIDDPVVVEEDQRTDELEALAAVEELLSDALQEKHGLREGVVEAMEAPQMVDQFRDEEEGDLDFEALAQTPQTGGDPDGGDDGDGGSGGADGAIEALSAEEREEVADKLDTAERMDGRTPEFAESLREEAAEIVGVEDAAEIDTEVL